VILERVFAVEYLLGSHTKRLLFGAIPSSPDFTPDTLWKPLRTPSPRTEKLVWLATDIIAAVAVVVLWLAITPLQVRDVTSTLSLPGFLVSFAGIVVVHELIHVLVAARRKTPARPGGIRISPGLPRS
jgi:hypothetical protein